MNSSFVKARVCHAAQEEYRLRAAGAEFSAEPSGKLRAFGELPAVGDWVWVRLVDGFGLIEEVLPRRTAFVRRAAGRGVAPQVLAANVDVALLVSGLDGDYNPRRLERYLVLARESGVDAVVVLNKADLCADAGDCRAEAMRLAEGLPVVVLSAHQGVEPLRPFLGPGCTAVLLGSSGAGKSTITNALLGSALQRTGGVRESDSRGRHTTTGRMLFPLQNGAAIIDTPGLRELQLWADAGSVEATFSEIADLAAQCRFHDCSHDSEPGCAVRGALDRGELDAGRWQGYRKLMAEAQHLERTADPVLQRAQKERWKAIHKAMRHHPKYRR